MDKESLEYLEQYAVKKEILSKIVKTLRDEQNESRSMQEELKKIVCDLSNAEHYQKVIEEYKNKHKTLEEDLRKSKILHERYKQESKTLWDRERLLLNNTIREHEKTIANIETLLNEKEKTVSYTHLTLPTICSV
eukprot:TRINITY_DN6951_c0_g1_i4.p1 TRINITY_DN6951_c0_g1~~TRINITY_DN6951_c0_g1_i4.p1  ORF type:complete len:135 (-),score=32.78 TRINITY_DN6951_c0_g1_i4:39-443(-)